MNGTLEVTAKFGQEANMFRLYSVRLDNGHRHFIRVTRMQNQMTVKVNDSVSINQEIPSQTAFSAEKLYLGNIETVLTPSTTVSTSSESSPVTLSTLVTLSSQVSSSIAPTVMLPSSPSNTISAEFVTEEEVTSPVTEETPTFQPDNVGSTDTSLDDLSESQTAPIRARQKRHFKGIILDVQLSNGGNVTRIVVSL